MRLESRLHAFAERCRGTEDVPLRIRLWDGTSLDLARDPRATVTIHTPTAALHLFRPSLSVLAEAFIEGQLDLEGSIWDIIRAGEAMTRRGPTKRPSFLPRLPGLHSRRLDAHAIQYHYDVSNDFYRLWLDAQMVYSCAYFKTGLEELHQAQEQKLDHVCRKLMLQPDERFLDIGCGWGALVRWAAKHYGVKATGITLSRNQYDYARERIRAEGLEDRCEVLFGDYRDLPGDGRFDKVASVGMVEHVGRANLPVYFGTIHRLLKTGGLLLNHGIATSEGNDGAHDLGGGDFIERYVFPHGETPGLSVMTAAMGRQQLEVTDVECLRPHYARTLQHWVTRLEARRAEAEELVGTRRYRIWLIYMAGCAHAFERGWVSVYQVLAGKAGDGLLPLPWTRDYLYGPSSREPGVGFEA